MRFTPARVGGRAVKQLVQQPFVFNISRSADAPLPPPGTAVLPPRVVQPRR
jgi:hypothetical protein